MNLFSFGKKEKSAPKAFDRLTLIIKRDRESNSMPYLENLKKDILTVLNKYTEGGNVNIKAGEDIFVDAAGNLVSVNSSSEALRVHSPPDGANSFMTYSSF
jgi:cell division topological specificity factor